MAITWEALKNELDGSHPVTGAYSMDAKEAADQLNALNISRNRTSMTGREVADEIVNADYDALTDENKTKVLALVASDTLDPFGFGANVVKDIFGTGSATLSALATARTETISRAAELGLGEVTPGRIEEARRL
jgi:hypothetical protein